MGVAEESGDRRFGGALIALPVHLGALGGVEVLALEVPFGESRIMMATL